MKKQTTFLLTAVLLICTLPFITKAQKEFTTADANRLFNQMQGRHEVSTLTWLPQHQYFIESTGKANYSWNKNKTLHEVLEIHQPDGKIQQLEGTLRYCKDNKHFEFVQYDTSGNATLVMVGQWDPSFKMIQLDPIKRLWQLNGKKRNKYPQLQLQYFFFDDGSFKKVLRSSESTGDSFILFEYHCLRQKTNSL